VLHLPVFVYGTLKQGECREPCWPRRPVRVVEATILGRLYDLGEYPALVEGGFTIAGELWRFEADDLPETLQVLDRIEWYTGGGLDLYTRRVIDCTAPAEMVQAYTYFFAHPEQIADRPVISPGEDGRCVWTGCARSK